MRIRTRRVTPTDPVVTVVTVVLGGCSDSGSQDASGPPSCTDTPASADRLARGCREGGTVYQPAVTRCVDGRTMYDVPDAPPHGLSGFGDGTLRPRAVTVEELTRCQTGTG